MNDDYLEAFVRESEENIVDLNNALLALENDPTDREAMDLIFRTAHTLKGNFSAMGFEATSRLAHAIEDLLDEIRHDRMAVSPEVMDLVFGGVDLIEAALSDIETDGEVSVDAEPVIDEIRTLIGEETDPAAADETAEAGSERTGGPESSGDLEDSAREALAAVDADKLAAVDPPIVHADVTLEDSEMPGVDGMLVLESVRESFDLAASVPSREAIEDGEYDGGFDLFTAGGDASAVGEALAEMNQTGAVDATDVTAAVETDSTGEPPTAGPDNSTGDAVEQSSSGAEPGAVSSDEVKSVRIDVDQLDALYGRVEQLVTSRIKLRRAFEARDFASADETLDELDKVSSSLQGTVMDMRMIPLKKVVNTFPRMVRDLAREQEKEIDFAMEGTEVELDRTILDEISDPLMHVLRNAVDHGIEPPDERERDGKPREGTIRLRARRERDHVELVVEDDGAGLDVEGIREKALEKDVRTAAELDAMDDADVYDLIFHPGFSTSEEVTDVSGRGVGMDVVASTVNRLDGSVSVDSAGGSGTTVTLRLPVSVAIVRVLFIEVAGREYGIPIKTIDEITQVEGIRTIDGTNAVEHKDRIYPVIDLEETLGAGTSQANGHGMLLRIRPEERQVTLRCDAVSRQEEVVIKPLDGELGDVSGMGGTAVIGDGNVVPIIDVGTL